MGKIKNKRKKKEPVDNKLNCSLAFLHEYLDNCIKMVQLFRKLDIFYE